MPSAYFGRLAALAAVVLAAGAGAIPAWGSATAPTAGAVIVDAPQPGTGVITGRVSAVDPDGDPLLFSAPEPTPKGSVSVAPDGTFVYTPGEAARQAAAIPGAGPEVTTDVFTVTVTDDFGGSLAVPVSVAVIPVEPPPAAPAPVEPPSAAVPVGPPGGLSFTVDYVRGQEFWTPEARGALETTLARLASYFVVAQPVAINLAVTGVSSPGAPNIASAWVGFTGEAPGFFPTVVQEKVQTGLDANGPSPDAVITVNFAESWSFSEQASGNAYDFRTTVLHEMLHAFGFLSGMGDLPDPDRHWNTYDSFLRAPDGSPVIDENFTLKPQYLANMTGGNGGLFFGGPNAMAAFGGPVPLFTPEPWASASRSLSHVNNLPGYLMEPFYGYGQGVRVISPVEIAILRDLGYTVMPQPPA